MINPQILARSWHFPPILWDCLSGSTAWCSNSMPRYLSTQVSAQVCCPQHISQECTSLQIDHSYQDHHTSSQSDLQPRRQERIQL